MIINELNWCVATTWNGIRYLTADQVVNQTKVKKDRLRKLAKKHNAPIKVIGDKEEMSEIRKLFGLPEQYRCVTLWSKEALKIIEPYL